MEEVMTCLCGCQNVWQIGEGYIKCTSCNREYLICMSANRFNEFKSVLVYKIGNTSMPDGKIEKLYGTPRPKSTSNAGKGAQ